MEVQLIECNKIDVPKGNGDFRTFSKEFAIKLADTIKVEGMYNAIVVRPNPESPGRYLLVQGKHRLYAQKNVLKQDLIAASVIADMDDAEAEMALIAENLWRNPLTKAQHVICVKRWFEHYLAKNPEKVGLGKAGRAAAVAKARGAKKVEAVETQTAEAQESQTDSLDADESKVEVASESNFAKKVAAATGQSEASAARVARIARAFTPDQLEAFNQMTVSQTDMLTIAKIKDEAQRGAVVNLIASGMEPEDAIKHVMGAKAPTRDNGSGKATAEAKAAAKKEKAPELNDDEWYAAYCGEKGAMFGNQERFKSDALLYRKITDSRHAFRAKSKASVKATAEKGVKGSFWSLVNRLMSVAHPKDWSLCPACKGTCKGADSANCTKCFGGGYLLKTEEYL